MDSTLKALATLACCIALPAAALNHEVVVAPISKGPFTVACSNIEMDPDRLAALGGTASDYWEGNPYPDGSERYVTDILANPAAAFHFSRQPPNKLSLYPTTFFRTLPFVALICHPTPRNNSDPDYVLPDAGGTVPHMQPAFAPPKLLSVAEYLDTIGVSASPPPPPGPVKLPVVIYSHGLGGSPLGKGYLDVAVELAAQGYVVAAVFHADARFSNVRIEDLPDALYALIFFQKIVEAQALRPFALKAMTDTLLADRGFSPAIDTDRLGAFGASLGGEAVAHLVGARLTSTLAESCSDPEHDPRIRAAVGYVPYSGQHFLTAYCDSQEGAENVNRPYLAISGTEDTTAPIELTQQAVNRMGSSHHMVELVGGKHELRLEDAPSVLTWMVTYLNAYLDVRSDPTAMARFIAMDEVASGRENHMIVDVHVPFANTGGETRVVEFHNTFLDHYFIAAGQGEIDGILAGAAGPGWELTGHSFKAWLTMPSDTSTQAVPVCRFYGVPAGGPNSHFFTASADECTIVKQNGGWFYEGIGFYIQPVTTNPRRCPDGLLSVNRAYNNGFLTNNSNHRFTTSDSTIKEMGSKGWAVEGTVMCARP